MGSVNAEHPISVRLPGYVVKKIDELIERKEFHSRSDFVRFAVTMALGQIMLEEARGVSKELTQEEVKAEAKEALRKLVAGEFED
ncbi:ribbon-helix-helix protein, CopG family [Thermococcus sp.]|uniref:ribbon-helix-helix protein, CopG family n=1 Tax=Thermococcus sp. TaxID=35749 RepID=UPI00257C231E|nr:ribbon-helix-helix protein, CopG family [Thermococcus sp.]